MRNAHFLAGTVAGLMVAATSAHALTINLGGGSIAGPGYTDASNAPTFTLNVSAFQGLTGTPLDLGAATGATVTRSSNGLGVNSSLSGDTDNEVDILTGNVGEGLLFDFGYVVEITGIVFKNWAAQDDFHLAYATGAAPGGSYALEDQTLTGSGTVTWTGSFTGSQFLIAAVKSNSNDTEDKFQISSITLNVLGPITTDPVDVPEPAALALFGLGLAGMGLARRRKTI